MGDKTSCGTELDECVKALARILQVSPLALGFEAPMFVPVCNKPICLTSARSGETGQGVSRPFSARAGASVLVTATVVVPYVLRGLRKAVPDATATLDWEGWLRDSTKPRQMFLFKAFVTNQNKKTDSQHFEDAKLAAKELYKMIESREEIKSSVTVHECFSILGAMMLRTGWSEDISVLSRPCLVVRPSTDK